MNLLVIRKYTLLTLLTPLFISSGPVNSGNELDGQLITAIRESNSGLVLQYVQAGADVNTTQVDGRPPVCWVAYNSSNIGADNAILDTLASKQEFDPDARDLGAACAKHKSDCHHIPESAQQTAVHILAVRNSFDRLQHLVGVCGAHPNLPDGTGKLPSSYTKNSSILAYLAEQTKAYQLRQAVLVAPVAVRASVERDVAELETSPPRNMTTTQSLSPEPTSLVSPHGSLENSTSLSPETSAAADMMLGGYVPAAADAKFGEENTKLY